MTSRGNAPTSRRKPTAIDLFAGAGGATQGLKDSGFRVLAAVESLPIAAESYRLNHPEVHVVEDDICAVDPHGLRKRLRIQPGSLTLLKACPPCQGYSTLGAGDVEDERNELVLEVWKFVQAFRPKAVMLENVPGLRYDQRLLTLVRQLRGSGYGVRTYLLDATGFGVPQRRRRVIVIAVHGRSALLPDELTELLPSWFVGKGMKNAGEALARSARVDAQKDRLHRARVPSAKVAERIKAIPRRGTRFDLPKRFRLECHDLLERREATASYARMRADAPAPTMTTRCTTPACGQFIHPTRARAITLREAATIQTFPLKYRFSGGVGQVESQIGNALPVRMARGLGLCLLSILAAPLPSTAA
jgi:DNA (cytosine-5)-methyltransferase 1